MTTLNDLFNFGLKLITIELTFGFGKKQLGDTKNFSIISNLRFDIIDNLP